MRPKWTRDEVILGLDVLFLSNCKNLTKNNPRIINLSRKLGNLSIYPEYMKRDDFRNPVGVSDRLYKFCNALKSGNTRVGIGNIFFTIYNEFNGNALEIHRVAEAIDRCLVFMTEIPYGNSCETEGFYEGAILSHTHRNIETRYTESCQEAVVGCEICGIKPNRIYVDVGNQSILGRHLLVTPADLDPHVKYTSKDYINVCPNCHRALHLTRPWCTWADCERILKV